MAEPWSAKRKADLFVDAISACENESQRKKISSSFLEMLQEIAEKEKEIAVLQAENRLVHSGWLQVQGLLTSKGLFERVAHLAFLEQVSAGHMRGRFNCTETLKQVPQTYKDGPWSRTLRNSIKTCAPSAKKRKQCKKNCKLCGLNYHRLSMGIRGMVLMSKSFQD